MHKFSSLTVALAVGSLVSVAGCTGDDEGADPTASTDGAGTAAPSDDAATSTSAGTFELAAPAAVECGPDSREPTELEARLLTEAGPYTGEAFDVEAAAEAVAAMNPQTDEDYAAAIAAQVQGGYAQDMCEILTLTTDLGDAAAGPTGGVPAESEAVGDNHFALVLDASGSMADTTAGGTRMDAAKDALNSFVDEVPEGSTVSLRIYGHEGDNSEAGKAESCASSEVVYDGPAQEGGFGEALDQVQPTGWTPLARAIGDSSDDIPTDATDAIVYVVTDGLETCGGDPVAAAEEVAAAGIEPVINVIGFEVGDADQAALRAIAEAGGGDYTQASSPDELDQVWREERERLETAWREWRNAERDRLVDTRDEKYETKRVLTTDVNGEVLRVAGDAALVTSQLGSMGVYDRNRQQDVRKAAWDHFMDVRGHLLDLSQQQTGEIADNLRSRIDEVYETTETTWSEVYREGLDN